MADPMIVIVCVFFKEMIKRISKRSHILQNLCCWREKFFFAMEYTS